MQIIKIKKKFTFWWRTYYVKVRPETAMGELGLSRPTLVLWLLNGDYLYIGCERIKEMKFVADKLAKEAVNGLQDGGGIPEAVAE